MSPITGFLILLLLLSCAHPEPVKKSKKPRSPAATVTLDFFRPPSAKIESPEPQQLKRILTELFPKFHLSESECQNGETPVITDSRIARGSFSKPDAKQFLLQLELSPCESGEAEHTGSLLLLEDQKILSVAHGVRRDAIRDLIDLDHDGIQEIILTGSETGQGHTTTYAELFSARNGQLQLVHHFGPIMTSSLEAVEDGVKIVAAFTLISLDPLTFEQKNYRACAPARTEGPDKKCEQLSTGPLEED